MSDYFDMIENKIAHLRTEIEEFEHKKDELDRDDPEWERITDEPRAMFRRYDLEIFLRREVIVLENLTLDRKRDERKTRYDVEHLEEAIAILKRFPEYVPEIPIGKHWGGEIIDAYRNQNATDSVWGHVRMPAGKDINGRRWSEVPMDDQLMYILAMTRRRLKEGPRPLHVQSWREGSRVMILGEVPEGIAPAEAASALREAVNWVSDDLYRFWTVEDFRKAINEL